MQRGVPYFNLSTYPIDEKLVRASPEWVVLQHKVVPLARVRREIHLAMLDPGDVVAIDTVARLLEGRVGPFLTTERDFDWAVTECSHAGRRCDSAVRPAGVAARHGHRGRSLPPR